ncbi:MAG: hypothetical protein K2Y22_14765 [Candidatus Obscuribacterales bacterium]|nr:hypothetical protein [Candidatus Obscuribacterales bacterium]
MPLTLKAGDYFSIQEVQENGFRVHSGSMSVYVDNTQIKPFGKLVATEEEAIRDTEELRRERFINRFGYEPGLSKLGDVRTSQILAISCGSSGYQDWEIYFSEKSKCIEVCVEGCNGATYTSREKPDGSTTLHPELDQAFQLLRKGEYKHPDPDRHERRRLATNAWMRALDGR